MGRLDLGLKSQQQKQNPTFLHQLEPVWTRIFHHSISVTHNSSLKIPYLFGTITHFSSLSIFHTICGPHTCHWCNFFFFILPKLIESSEKKKKKTKQPTQEKKKKKKKRTNNQCQPRKKKIKRWSKVAAMGPLCVFNYHIAIEL